MPIKIPLLMRYINPDGTDCLKTLIVRLSDPINNNAKKMWRKDKPDYTAYFSLSIPDHIWKYLAGRMVLRGGTQHDRHLPPSKYGSTPKAFPKTISARTLNEICDQWAELLTDYRWIVQVDDAGLDKVIFYSFDTNVADYRDQWSSKSLVGNISRITYVWSIGYRTKPGHYDFSEEYRYDMDQHLISRHQEKRFYELKFVKWTAEREAFFRSLQSDFEVVIGKVWEFEKMISERGLKKLMAGQRKLLGS